MGQFTLKEVSRFFWCSARYNRGVRLTVSFLSSGQTFSQLHFKTFITQFAQLQYFFCFGGETLQKIMSNHRINKVSLQKENCATKLGTTIIHMIWPKQSNGFMDQIKPQPRHHHRQSLPTARVQPSNSEHPDRWTRSVAWPVPWIIPRPSTS